MSPLPAMALFLAITAVVLTLVVSAVRAARPAPADQPHPLEPVVRHSSRTRAAATLLALAAAAAAYLSGRPEGLALFGVVGLVVLLRGEHRAPVVTATTRTASLSRRRVHDYLPATGLTLLLLALLALAADAAVGIPVAARQSWDPTPETTLAAGSYFLGVSTTPTGELITGAYYPWPGPRLLVPLALGLAVQLAIALPALHWLTTRGQVGACPGPLDHALRRYRAEGVLGLLLVSTSLALPVLGTSMIDAATWETADWDYGRGTIGGVGIVVALAAMAYGALLLARSPRQVAS